MGKTKKGKSKPHKKNPTGLQSLRDLENEGDGSTSSGPINTIIDQLQSASNDEKMCGLQSLSTLCQRELNIKQIIDSDLVRIAAPLLIDPDINVRQACSGCLRNLSCISVEICERLVEQDVFTPLQTLLCQYANNEWLPTNDKKVDVLDQKSDTFLQAVNIMWNLCESTSVALEFFNQSQLLQSFVRCLDHEKFGMEISISTAQCLLVISEDNPAAWRILAEFVSVFQNVLKLEGTDYKTVILRTVVAGVASNVPALTVQCLHPIIETLSKTIEINHRQVLNELTSRLPLNENETQEPTAVEIVDDEMREESEADASARRLREDLPTELDNDIKNVGYLLSAQRTASEILTNICSSEGSESKDEMEDISDAESVHDYDINEHQNGNGICEDKIPVEMTEAIKAHKIVEKLWARSQPLAENVKAILMTSEKNLYKRQNSLRISTLICLHNLCNVMTTEELGGATAIYNVWLDLGQQIFQIQQDYESLEASTSLMRATLEHLKKSRDLFQQVSDSDLQLILDGIQNCDKSEVRANWLRMLGSLGCLLAEPLVKKITDFMLETTIKEDDVWTISEALDSFMDMFSDNDWNQIVHELNVVPKSKELEKILKTKMKQRKRELGDRYPAIVTIKTNFTRFCKYLETQQKSFVPNPTT
ncbi:unnamed protein product [Chironomus riparius]|uniref:SYO1-like TPR repeats domain-containing protein n=1 Tax=Chironomus riparius TaxID=315576 RepID=A0A9N9WJU8_9DIPT|nr:unnamed protein product [Chironomus riparius]